MTRRLRSLRVSDAPTTTGDGRTVRVRLVAWDAPSMVTDDGGRTWYSERFARGGLQLPGDVAEVVLPAALEHHGQLVGRIVAASSEPDGLYADVRVTRTAAGDDLLAMVDDGLLSVSVEFDDDPTAPAHGADVTRTAAVVRGLAFTHVPQHTTAAVLGRRSHHDTEDHPMDENTTTTTTPDPASSPAGEPAPVTPTPAPAPAEPTALRSFAGRPDPGLSTGSSSGRPITGPRFRSFGDFVMAAAQGQVPLEERERYYRALAGATTADTAGLLQVQWISEVIDLIRPTMPTVQAFSTRPLPEKGLTVQRPIVTQRPTWGKQTTQGAVVGSGGIASQKVTIGTASWTVDTYGGGQGMTLQTILRTDPDYLDQVMRLYAVEAARKLETDVVAAVLAAADDVNTTAIELPNTDAALVNAFVDACDVIMGAIDRFPEFAVINRKMWVKLAKAVDSAGRPLFPGVSPLNPVGRIDLTSTEGDVRGLRFVVAPKMANTIEQAIVAVPEAFETQLGAMQTLQNDVPETLSREFAMFQFAAFGKVDASGLVLITNAV